jgi:uncharacterized coiled-coil protein SlyX
MDSAIAGRIKEWDARPVSGGYQGLRELADASFSGAVTTGTAWLFLLNGRVVGVVDGPIEAFESGEVTAYQAPDPGLPLLFAMQEQGGETRAKYYTDDNPLREVHETLAEGGFTGYIELSENVLSGDYFVVYYGGKSMSVAFVGNAEKLLTGDEAFREAADEVGIYEVTDVELDVRTVPEPEADDAAAAAVDVDDDPAVEESAEPADEPPADQGTDTATPSAGGAESTPEPAAEPTPEPEAERTETPTGSPEATSPNDAAREAPREAEDPADPEDPFSEEAAWRETRTIPALDPEESESQAAGADGVQEAASEPTEEPTPATGDTGPPAQEPVTGEPDDDRIAELEAAIDAQSETIAELESKLESSATETQQLREEREQLRAELESARSVDGGGDPAPAGESLDPETTLDQTDLFVRYGTKSGGTLEKAHDGELDREEVVNNLRIDHHTRFEEDEVVVDGQPFDDFLRESLEYRFVDWLVTQLLFEIQDTGSQRGLRDLFDAIPRIDRAEFHGTVTWRDQEEGETYEESFDVVCRDRMGDPLVVANLNDVRDPATGDMMDALIEGASAVAEGAETLGGAFMITSSFFRPDALETASEATGGGLLAREKRWSYVKLSRRHGYHLCLVEARGDDFHVAVPEL